MQDRQYSEGERLQKLLARTGRCSRRIAEQWITAGRLRVNGRIATLGIRVKPGDEVRLDSKRLSLPQAVEPQVLLYHKDCGEICAHRDARPSVFDKLPATAGRWISVGRLDINTSGLLLFTNDGALAHALMHPSSGIEREYVVRVRGAVNEGTLERLQTGVLLEDGIARFSDIQPGGEGSSNRWFHVVLMEGRNREVRTAVGIPGAAGEPSETGALWQLVPAGLLAARPMANTDCERSKQAERVLQPANYKKLACFLRSSAADFFQKICNSRLRFIFPFVCRRTLDWQTGSHIGTNCTCWEDPWVGFMFIGHWKQRDLLPMTIFLTSPRASKALQRCLRSFGTCLALS